MEKYFNLFKARMHSMAALKHEDWDSIQIKLEVLTLKAGQVLTQLGSKAHYFIFVCEGLFREMEINNLNILSINRYLLPYSVCIGINPASTAKIEAITDGVILLLSEQDVYKLDYEQRIFRKHFRLFLIQYVKDLRLRGDILACKDGSMKYQFLYQFYEEVCKTCTLTEQGLYLNLNKDTVCRLRANYFP